MNITHILVHRYSWIEEDVVCFYDEQEMKNYIRLYPDVLDNKHSTFYKVEKIEPKQLS
jgi:hypothetical protein